MYDLIVIGWGKAGKTLAAKLAAKGKKIAVVEENPKMYGGTCINVGCLPTKSLVHSAKLISQVKNYGIDGDYEFKNNFLYSELEREIFIKMYMRYEDKIVKKFFKTLYLKDELIGYVFGIPDYAEFQYKGKIETMILKTIAVSPKYNGKGMGYILIDELVKEAEKSGYKNVIYALMYEKNISKNIGLLLGDELRRYTLFIKEL